MADAAGSRGRWLRGDRADVVLAVVVGVFVVFTTVVRWDPQVSVEGVPPLGWVLMIVGSAALAVRRRYPVSVAVITLVATMAYYPLLHPDGALLVTLIIALYTLSSEGLLLAAMVISFVAVLGAAYGELGSDASPIGDAGLFLLVSWLVAAVALGSVTRSRRDYLHEAQQRARDAERNREEALRRRATEERLRIARELHDVLGHNISLINVQASAALHGLHRDPSQAAESLAAIKQTSREALQELRTTLGVLRQVDDEAPTAPAPSLSQLDELIDRTRAAGLRVAVQTEDAATAVPAAVDLAAYRIVQEALTNVTRHAGAGKVVVRVRFGRDDVRVDVEDDGRGGAAEAGNGIRGMRERAHALGGSLDVGERPDGGYQVSARLPFGAGR